MLLRNYPFSSSTLSSKNDERYSETCAKNKYFCFHVCDYMIYDNEMRLKMKNRSHRYDINRPRLKQRHTYTIYKICLNMMMVICTKEHLSSFWSTIHKKVKQRWGWVEKKWCLSKKGIAIWKLFKGNFILRFKLL